ncbi:MAG: YIP1 family protein [Gammaproteobacteria bacterium]|nr:YIP1 family protein [Gammaproteobacteria bacterium]
MSESTHESAPGGSAFAQLGNLFVAPSQALDYALEHAKMWWLPFAIVLGLQLILGIWIAVTINIDVLHAMMAQAMAQTNPEQAQQTMEVLSQHGRGFFMLMSIVGVIVLGIGEVIFALYLFLADKLFSAANRGFGKWFSFTAWTWLPLAIAIIISGIVWALSSHATGMPTDPTSLNALLFHLESGDFGFSAARFSILQFWIIGLVAFGLKRWCGHSWGKATVIALVPYIVYYGLQLLI